MDPFIVSPKSINPVMRLMIFIAEKITGKAMLPARLLAWYPKAAFSSGVMESLVAHDEGACTARLLKLVRVQTSMTASCPFCIDMNYFEFEKFSISSAEVEALQGILSLEDVSTFSSHERAALRYARSITATPVSFTSGLIGEIRELFTEREIVVLATTAAQVNYWARFIQAMGIPPAGYSAECPILKLKDYRTLKG